MLTVVIAFLCKQTICRILCRIQGHAWLVGSFDPDFDCFAIEYCEYCGITRSVPDTEIQQWRWNREAEDYN